MTEDMKKFMDAVDHDEDGFLVFDNFDEMLDFLSTIMDDDYEEEEEKPSEDAATKEAPEEELTDEEKEIEELRKRAKAQHDEIADLLGKELADDVVDYAAAAASLVCLLRGNIPLPKDMVDRYNELCERVHPETCTPLSKLIAYRSVRELVKEGKASLE